MANRFLSTTFFKSTFVRGLKAPLKTLYVFIICDCEGSGIWNLDLDIASLYTDAKVTFKEFDDAFIKTGKAIEVKPGRYFFPDFIHHQYPTGLSATNPAHKNFIIELQKYQLLDGSLKVLDSPINGTSVMVKEKVMVTVKVNEQENPEILLTELQQKIKDSYPNVSKIKNQLTTIESEKLMVEYPMTEIITILDAMENKKDLTKKYLSVNLTLRNWIKRNFNHDTKSGKQKIGRIDADALDKFINS